MLGDQLSITPGSHEAQATTTRHNSPGVGTGFYRQLVDLSISHS